MLERLLRRFFIACISGAIGAAQPIAVGVRAGVPLSPESQDNPALTQAACGGYANNVVCGPNELEARPYAVGPTVEVFLPFRLSVEADALYRRFHQDISTGLLVPHGGSVSFGTRAGLASDGWLFPLLLKYSPIQRKFSFFGTAGATLRHLGSFDGQGFTLDFSEAPLPAQPFHIETGRDLDAALTFGAGVRFRVTALDFSPEIRFLHWTSAYYQPAQNQAMLMLGITFPARKR